MSFLKITKLLADGDVKSNPGPAYSLLKTISGSFHQGHPKFGKTAEFNMHAMPYLQSVGRQ